MEKYDFDTVVPRRGTNSYKWDTPEQEGVLPMWVADMDFRAAPCIVEALRRRVSHGVFGYTRVPAAYYDAVTDWFARRHGWRIDPHWILYTTGVVPALSAVIKALTVPGDRVIVQTPAYNCFYSSIRNNGCELLANRLRYEGGAYTIDFDDLETKASDPKAKLLLLCNPHNPVGRVWTAEELRMLGDICVANDVMILCDEIHGDLEHPGHAVTMFGTLGERYADHLIEFTAPSKSFNLAGLLCSNAIFHNAKVKQEFDIAAAKTGGSTVNHLGMVACMAAYARCEDWFEEMLAVVRRNLDTVRAFADTHDGIRLIEPEGTYLAWLDCRGLGLSNDELETFMHEQARLYFDEGYLFGQEGSGFERINLACPVRVIERMCRQLDAALCKLGVGPVAADFADCV